MNKLLFLTVLSLAYTTMFAQLDNSGGTIVIESGATLTLKDGVAHQNTGTLNNDGKLIIEGSLTNTGNFTSTAATSRMIFTGSSASNFASNNISVRSLELQKTNSDLNLTSSLNILDTLKFNSIGNSKLVLNASNLTLSHTATVTGSSVQQYIETNGTGFLIKEFNAADNFTFPVGNLGGLTEIQTDVTGTSFVNARLKVKVNDTEEPNLPVGTISYLKRHWIVEAENISNYENEVMASYLAADVVGQENDIEGGSYDGASWSYLDAGRGTSIVSGSISSLNSTFTGIESGVPLPVELLTFTAKKKASSSVELLWTTASELNTSHYIIERSRDATHWHAIGTLSANNQSYESSTYAFIDSEIPQDVTSQGVLYYRLHIIDFDGYREYSPVDVVTFGDKSKSLRVYPNPTSDVVNFASKVGQNEVMVFNSLGTLIYSVENASQISMAPFPAGIYRVSVRTGGEVQLATVIKNE